MQVGAGDVLRRQQQEEEEGQVGRGVADELDEGFLDEAPQSALWGQQVDLRRRERNTSRLEDKEYDKQKKNNNPHPQKTLQRIVRGAQKAIGVRKLHCKKLVLSQ